MANNRIRLIGLIVMLVVLSTGVIGTWVTYGKDITANTKAVTELDEEGCELSNKHKIDIALIGKDISTIREAQTELKVEQTKMRDDMNDGFKEILRRLPE